MRFLLIAVLLIFAPAAFAQAPDTKPDTKAALAADELEMLTDSVTQIEKANQDRQSANLFMEAAIAKQERSAILLEARKLKMLNSRGLSDATHEVAYVVAPDGKSGAWTIREKPKEKPKP